MEASAGAGVGEYAIAAGHSERGGSRSGGSCETTCINGASVVLNLYRAYLRDNNTVMTTFDMNRVLRKKWRRFDSFELVKITLEVPKAIHQMNAVASESMDQYWIEKKTL